MDEIKTNIVEGSGDIIEYCLDFFTENEVVKDFPILGTVIKIGFTVKSISDRIFIKKIERFFFHYKNVTEKEKMKMTKKIS